MTNLFKDEYITQSLAWLDRINPVDSPAVVRHAQFLILDTLGCVNAAYFSPTIKELEDQFSTHDPGPHCINNGPRMSSLSIAQLFAYSACWYEACEGHASAHGRPGIATLAAIYPFVKTLSYRQVLTAFVYGYELSVRFAQMLRIKPGMHVDGNWPTIGAAVAVGKCLNLSNEHLVKAINIACTQIPMSLYLPIRQGASSRNSYLGHAATLGIQCAMSAKTSLSTPNSSVLEYATIALENPNPEWTHSEKFELLSSYIKPFASVRHVHYGAIAAMRLRPKINIDEIKEIELDIYQEATVYCGNRSPRTPIQAQFSLSFGIAAALVFNHLNFEIYSDEVILNTKVIYLEKIIKIKINSKLSELNQRGATVSILDNTKWHIANVDSILGDSNQPMSEEQIKEKFIHYSKNTIGEIQSDLIWNNLLTENLDQNFAELLLLPSGK